MDDVSGRPSKQQKQAPAAHTGGVFVDAITERHISSNATELLQRRCLTHTRHYGWTYDVWIDDAGRYALTGAHSRFSLPAIAHRVTGMMGELASAAGQQAQRLLQGVKQQQQQQQQEQQQQQQPRGQQLTEQQSQQRR